MIAAQLTRQPSEVFKVWTWIVAERGNGHQPTEPEPISTSDGVGDLTDTGRNCTCTAGICGVEIDLNQAAQTPLSCLSAARQRVDQFDPVDAVNHVGVASYSS